MKTKENRKKIIAAGAAYLLLCGIAFVTPFVCRPFSRWGRLAVACAAYLLMGVAGAAGCRLCGVKMQLPAGWNKPRTYLGALLLAAGLLVVFALLPLLCGLNVIGSHIDPDAAALFRNAVHLLLFVGPVEELCFRVFLQTLLAELMPRPWQGALAGAVLFGLWHIINGGLFAVLWTFLIGCVFAWLRHRGSSFLTLALSHGLYDLSLVFVQMFLIRA